LFDQMAIRLTQDSLLGMPLSLRMRI
jgi:hypothetical protein